VNQSQRHKKGQLLGNLLRKSGWPGSRMFWPCNDLAALLRWRYYCMWLRRQHMKKHEANKL